MTKVIKPWNMPGSYNDIIVFKSMFTRKKAHLMLDDC